MSLAEAKEVLRSEGLSNNASTCYLGLLKTGSTNLSGLAAATRLHPQSVKNALGELVDRGLVTRLDHKVTQSLWRPVPPYEIAHRLRQKVDRFARLMPALQELYREKTAHFLRVYGGVDHPFHHYQRLLQRLPEGSLISIVGLARARIEATTNDEYRTAEEIRQRKKIRKQVVVGPHLANALRRQPHLMHEPLAEYKILPAAEGRMTIMTAPNEALLMFFDPSEPMTISISGKKYAEQFQKQFALMWSAAHRKVFL